MYYYKQILNDVLDYAFPGDPKLPLFKKYSINIYPEKKLKSRHGECDLQTHEIRVFNFYRADTLLLGVLLHELAHHVDWAIRGTSNHDKNFYDAYRNIIYAALNMRLVKPEEILNADHDAADKKKVDRMVQEYIPQPVDYKVDSVLVTAINCYDQKELLKSELKFRWNSITKTWWKEVKLEDLKEELIYLEQYEVEYNLRRFTSLYFDHPCYIYANGNTYDYREQLKQDGFWFSAQDKLWIRKVPSEREKSQLLEAMIIKYPALLITGKK